ncbi:MAG: exodeoxyribonuclease VII small subunit [Eubacteriales bacterium]|nr:exodeoxyribonuclease VII small subunit [Eubacteriales bacterium]
MGKKETERKPEEFRLEEAFERIEGLLGKLQEKDVTLEESFSLYQEGMQLLKLCNEKIDHVEKRMLQIDEEGQTHEFS